MLGRPVRPRSSRSLGCFHSGAGEAMWQNRTNSSPSLGKAGLESGPLSVTLHGVQWFAVVK